MRRRRSGFSLVELLIVVSIMGILAAVALPSLNPGIHEQLQAAARIVSGDLAYGRSLAVSNNSQYCFTFDLAASRYVLTHSGSDPALNTLPDSPYRSPSDPPDRYTVDLPEVLHLGGHNVRVAAIKTAGGSNVLTLEFGPLGETTRVQETIIWLAAGRGAETRYLTVSVHPTTGLETIGSFTASGPERLVAESEASVR
jgi:prepilin-type N-terminal cleavage/methylation domain-containing protein